MWKEAEGTNFQSARAGASYMLYSSQTGLSLLKWEGRILPSVAAQRPIQGEIATNGQVISRASVKEAAVGKDVRMGGGLFCIVDNAARTALQEFE